MYVEGNSLNNESSFITLISFTTGSGRQIVFLKHNSSTTKKELC